MSIFRNTRTRGFTFTEVLISVAILAILSTVVYASLGGARKKARDTQRKSDITQLQLSLRLYKDSNNGYPVGYNAGVVIGEGGGLDATLLSYLAGTIVSDPMGGAADVTYEYVYDSSFDCAIAGAGKKVLYAKTMEAPNVGNWAAVCGTNSDGTSAQTYGVILQ